ncbi:hypothetical protein [Kitasatospora sp. NPDC059817]|uniref:hypothetical protein n=1 Tax=Kitasatospora sp. NPDC059817 TaxID=3346961 RepID=UPI0036562B71
MDEPAVELLSRLWEAHVQRAFPPHLRGRDIDGEDLVLLDAFTASGVSSVLSGHLDENRRGTLLACLAALEKVLPSLGDEGGGAEYYERLHEMAVLAAELGNARPR